LILFEPEYRISLREGEDMKSKLAILMLAAVAVAAAQGSNGYLFFAPGGITSYGHTEMTMQAGGGVDVMLLKGIGANAEIGALWPRQCFADCVIGVLSPGGSYHFLHRKEGKIDPFVGAGYSFVFRAGHLNLFNFGGGANYWFAKRFGLRMEFRDQVYTRYATTHFWGFRAGVAIR
jgi:hypothetical protein